MDFTSNENYKPEEKYKQFHSKLAKTNYEIDGVRIPALRKIAKTIAKSRLPEIKSVNFNNKYEFVMIYGLAVGYSNFELSELYRRLNEYLPYIDCWSICDSVCATIKPPKKEKEEYFRLLIKLTNKKEEFTARFGIASLMMHYIDDKHIDEVLDIYINLAANDGEGRYYVQMGLAWGLTECFVKYKEKTEHKIGNINPEIRKMTLRKIKDSFRT